MRQHALAAGLLLLGLSISSPAAEMVVERYLLLRDGSILRLPVVDEVWKIQVLCQDGRIEPTTIRLSELRRITFTAEPPFEKKRVLLSTIQKLGADEYTEREKAQDALTRMGPAIRPDVELVKDLFQDAEIRSRLRSLLAQWPEGVGATRPEVPFDVFTGKETMWGDAGAGGIAVRVDGQTRRLGRKDILALTRETPDVASLGAPGPSHGVRRLQESDFPRGCLAEGFETTPDGRKLKVGENIERLYVSKGFLLSTSVKSSYVSVNDFVVQGKSRGLSVATHLPLFTGEVTITFVKPGHAEIPAGVTHFGCWMAWIEPNGTALHAYDLQGRELGQVSTTRSGHEFLGLYSPVPIHKITIVPNLRVDPDYTLDDFLYTPPQTADLAHPQKYTTQFRDGERVLCREVRFTEQGVCMSGLPAELPDRTRPLAELVRVLAPDDGKERPTAPGVFVELRDGSVLFGARPKEKDGAPVFARRPGVLQEPEQIVGLWSAANPRAAWLPVDPKAYPAVGELDKSGKPSWVSVGEVKLGEEAVEWTTPAAQKVTRSYGELTPLLLREPPANAGGAGSWHVRTRIGEDLVLSDAEPPRLAGSLTQELVADWHGQEIKIPAAEIVSVYRVTKGP